MNTLAREEAHETPGGALAPSFRRVLLALGLGNAVELYDWMLFGMTAAYLGPQFFPSGEPLAPLLAALLAFAIGFIFRPLGAIALGGIADRVGRKPVIMISIGTMSVTLLVMSILPGYSAIGAAGGIILVVLRALQGMSMGVEAPLVTSYIVEVAPEGRENRAGVMVIAYNYIGMLAASLFSFLISLLLGADAFAQWGWRIPFAIGGVVCIVVLFLRRSLPESISTEERAENSLALNWSRVAKNWLGVLAIVFVVGAGQAFLYAWDAGLPGIARGAFSENPTQIFAITTVGNAIALGGTYAMARLTDRRRLSAWFFVVRLLVIPTVFIMLLYVAPGIGVFAFVLLAGSFVLTADSSISNVVSASLVPKNSRGLGFSMGHGIGVTLFGGTSAYVMVWCQQRHSEWLFPAYIAVLSAISIVLYLLSRRTNGLSFGR